MRAPDGSQYLTKRLREPKVTVGRLPDINDIALQPDAAQLVTRREHFAFEKRDSGWIAVDSGSLNGTYVKRGDRIERIVQTLELSDGDVVCVLGDMTGQNEPKYWEFEFGDRDRTRPVRLPSRSAHLSYDVDTARLFLVRESGRQEIQLRRQAHRLVRFMSERNAEAGSHALCSHAELMEAVWGDEPFHTREELTRLFWELRSRLQPLRADHLVESVRGLGYRLRTLPGD